MRLPTLPIIGSPARGDPQKVVRLAHRRVYILPSGQCMAFLVMLVVMVLWAINYINSLAFGLTFMVAAVMLNSLWVTHRNLLGLEITAARAEAVFAGQQARFPLRMVALDGQPCYGIGVRAHVSGETMYGDVPASGGLLLPVPVVADSRGWLSLGAVRIHSVFPLGLFRTWSWISLDQRCLVYPRPAGDQPLPVSEARTDGTGGVASGSGVEDFEGLRGYVPGDSLRHIAWKAATRNETLPVKTFHGETRRELWLDWNAVRVEDTEARLSQLCHWLLQAETEGLDYGLRLPGLSLAPASGESHRRLCLEALAVFGRQPAEEHRHAA